jgi:hypothetical protein
MVVLFRYFAGVAVILPVVMILSAITMSEIFLGFAAVERFPTTETPRWSIGRLKAEPDTQYIPRRSLSPIYPAIAGKELLGKSTYTASVKPLNTRQALQLHKLPPQLYARGEQNSNYLQQTLSYTEARTLQPRTRIVFGHGIY